MTNVAAFVAHSFTEDDAQHVNRVLEFLTRISKLNSRFSWAHAREAEPTDLKEKVFRSAGNANLLIAICSRKERVFRPDAARRSRINRDELVVPDNQCSWATSDWITQEIGMALGRNWTIIILLEDGVRNPGGMQGNLEYIQFDRSAPERSFQGLMEMISSQTNDGSEPPEQASIGNVQLSVEPAPITRAAQADSPLVPNASMTLDQLERGIVDAFIREDQVLLHQYDEAFRASEAGASEEGRGSWEARREWLHEIFKGSGDHAKVRSLAGRYQASSTIAHYHALLLSELGEADAAGAEFSRSASLVGEPKNRVQRLADGARSFLKSDNTIAAFRLLADAREALKEAPSEQAEVYLIDVLSEVFGTREKLLQAAVAERLVQLRPDDQDARFRLAYLYGDNGQSSLALRQYLRIPHEVRSDWAWNNLGVTYGALSVKGKAVDAYERAEAIGNSLATSNRARLLRDAGFFELAEMACQQAFARPNPDFAALSETLSSVASQREDEQKKEAETLRRAQSVEVHMRKLGAALVDIDSKAWSGMWKGPAYEMEIVITPDGLAGKARFERPTSRLGISGLGDAAKSEAVIVEIVAKTYGHAAYGKVETKVGSSLATLLGGLNFNRALLVIDDAAGIIQVLEVVGDGDYKAYELRKV